MSLPTVATTHDRNLLQKWYNCLIN